MWDVTGWAVAVWAKWTVVLAVVAGITWLLLPAGSGWFQAICAAAVGLELLVTRQLGREWVHHAHCSWWWAR
ncbi:MAG: hypothetical protein ACRDRH_22030 [Pseudonocardia sp.]